MYIYVFISASIYSKCILTIHNIVFRIKLGSGIVLYKRITSNSQHSCCVVKRTRLILTFLIVFIDIKNIANPGFVCVRAI